MARLRSVISAVMFCGRQNIALRGHRNAGACAGIGWGGGGVRQISNGTPIKIFLGTGQPQGLLYLIHWEAQPQAKPINRN